jgi:hypothetical protein
VLEDWRAWLPGEKRRLFDATLAELETSHAMLSIALDEAFGLRDQSRLAPAREQAGISVDLFHRLATRLLTLLRALEEHGRHFGTLPNLVPLNPEYFRGETAQRIARKNNLLSRVLLSMRSRFFHKLRDLAAICEELVAEFREAAEEVAEGSSVHPVAHWMALDELHYDLTTCLHETTILLKSFLHALPNEEVQPFMQRVQVSSTLPPLRARVPWAQR